MLVPVAAVAAVVAVVVGAYVLMAVTGARGRAAQAATVVVAARRAIALLEQERQQMIAIYDASRSTKVLAAPKIASTAKPVSRRSGVVLPLGPVDPGSARAAAENMMPSFGWSPSKYFGCLDNLWTRESGWRYNAENPSGAYGIPQALPGSKMATAGADWQTNPVTQIKWGLGYIQERYGDPCSAWSYWQVHESY